MMTDREESEKLAGLREYVRAHGRRAAEDFTRNIAMRLLKLRLLLFVCAAVAAISGCTTDAKVRTATPDVATRLSQYRIAAEQGNADAQNEVGFMYEVGLGVSRDLAVAESWYRKAAAQGNFGAQNSVQRLARASTPTSVPNSVSTATPPRSASRSSIPMKKEGTVYVVPVFINNAITLDFLVDSGASDVSIPADVVTTLIRAGAIRDTDFGGERTYVLADGSRVQSKTFRIRSLKVGDRVLENVAGSVASTKGALLLGQSFLGRFKS